MKSARRWFPAAVVAAVALAGLLGVPGGSRAQVLLGGLELELDWSDTGILDSPLDHPMGVAVAPSGAVLVADTGNSRIVVYEANGRPVDVWELPRTSRPVGLAVRPDGTVIVADATGDRLFVLGLNGQIVDTWGHTGTGPGEFQAPSGVAVTATGGVLVVEFLGQRVQELDSEGGFVRFIDGGESARDLVASRPSRQAMGGMQMPTTARQGDPHGLFSFPSDVAIAPDGTLFVSNTHAYQILVFDPDGELRAAWGSKGAAAGQWEVPVGITTDACGNLYVADSANFRIQGLDPAGRPFLVSRAQERWYRTTRRIYSPTDVAVDPDGRLYVADFAASRVQRFRRLREN